MIAATNLEKFYHTDEVMTIALNKISFSVDAGEFVAIMGPSGCGKSTLLNILGFLDEPDGGSLVFDGCDASRLSEKQRTKMRKHHVGFVFQNFNLIDDLTVFENIELPLAYSGIKARERKKRVDEVLEKMHIMHRRNHFPHQLSGGQQQRAAVARSIINNPKLLLADEPTGNLDRFNGTEVMDMLTELNIGGMTIIMVTHSEHDAKYGHRIIRMLDGQKVTENLLI